MSKQFPRSPYDDISGLVYFPRMVEKIRQQAAGTLPEEYLPMLGDGFDGRCARFLRVEYADLKKRTLQGGTDSEVLEWCHAQGFRPNAEDIEVWSGFMTKRGWRDETRERVDFRLKEAGLDQRAGDVGSMFDFIDLDEGRPLRSFAGMEPPRS